MLGDGCCNISRAYADYGLELRVASQKNFSMDIMSVLYWCERRPPAAAAADASSLPWVAREARAFERSKHRRHVPWASMRLALWASTGELGRLNNLKGRRAPEAKEKTSALTLCRGGVVLCELRQLVP